MGTCLSAADLVARALLKTRGSFVGCMGWPDCDVAYPLPQGRVEALEERLSLSRVWRSSLKGSAV